jgi:hypothetical protein
VDAVESMEMDPGVNPRPPKLVWMMATATKLFVDGGLFFRVFASKGIYRRKGEVGGG